MQIRIVERSRRTGEFYIDGKSIDLPNVVRLPDILFVNTPSKKDCVAFLLSCVPYIHGERRVAIPRSRFYDMVSMEYTSLDLIDANTLYDKEVPWNVIRERAACSVIMQPKALSRKRLKDTVDLCVIDGHKLIAPLPGGKALRELCLNPVLYDTLIYIVKSCKA